MEPNNEKQNPDSHESLSNNRVLLVDDNPTNLQVLSQSLTGQGLTLLAARSGEEAIEVAAKANPALILLDINMPVMDGFETCQKLKADPNTAKSVVVFLSARDDAEDRVRGLQIGAADYISKPFNVDEVLARVKTQLTNYHKNEELNDLHQQIAVQAPLSSKELNADQLLAMIRAGESDRLEFKSTLRWNLKADRAGKEIENAWLKTVVAFLNSEGGVVLIGVEDDGNVCGISADQFPNSDRYMLHANNLINETIGADHAPFINFDLRPIEDKEILTIRCLPSPNPVFLKRDGQEDFFIRIGPGSRKLSASEILSYVKSRESVVTDEGLQAIPSTIATEVPAGQKVLLVDDNAENLSVLFRTLDGQGHELLVARSGEEALELVEKAQPDLILLDIMMPPGIDGYETCARLKNIDESRNIPVIFMSALDETRDKLRGFEVGAIDYISKPFQADETIARVNTHLQLRQLQNDLAKRNKQLESANRIMKADLDAAARVQQAMLPQNPPDCPGYDFGWFCRPCTELGGDSLDIFRINPETIGFFLLDVSGHGVPASLLAITATRNLAPRRDRTSLVIDSSWDSGTPRAVPPAEVVRRLNVLNPMDEQNPHFITMIYGILECPTGRIRYACAGHPSPIIVRKNGSYEVNDAVSLPIGLDSDEVYEELVLELNEGDRMFLHSDGANEQMNPDGEFFGRQRLCEHLSSDCDSPSAAIEVAIQGVENWADTESLTDDMSFLAIERQ